MHAPMNSEQLPNPVSNADYNALVVAWPAPAVLASRTGALLTANLAAEQLFETYFELWSRVADWIPIALGRAEPVRSFPVHVPSGMLAFEWSAAPAGVDRVILTGRDVTLERNLRQALTESRQRFKDLVEVASDFAWEVGEDGKFAYVSGNGALGYDHDLLIGHSPLRLDLGDMLEVKTLFLTDDPFTARDFWLRTQDKEDVCVTGSATPIHGPDGRWIGARGACRDVTEARQRQSELARARAREQAINRIVLAVRDEVDSEHSYQRATKSMALALGARGCRITRVVDRRGEEVVGEHGTAPEGLLLEGIGERLAPDGTPTRLEVAGYRLVGAHTFYRGAVIGSVLCWRPPEDPDYSPDDHKLVLGIANQIGIAHAHALYQDQLRRLSERDGLTGLYNRRTFMDKLAERLDERRDEPSAILYIDLDNFKAVNDTHGHQAGDNVLVMLSEMLHHLARRGDLPARLGGDEFLIWIGDADQARAETAAQDLIDDGRHTIGHMSASDEKPLGMSIGVALHLPGVAETADELVAKADHVMYTAKRSGKNRFATIDQLPETS